MTARPQGSTPLPRLLLLTDRRACATRGRSLAETVGAACAAGIGAVVLREKDLGKTRRLTLGRELATRLSSCAGRLIIASDAELAAELGASLHLAATDALPAVAPEVVGRSCHDVESLLRALAEGVAYATLSPTFASSSKPGYGPTLGVEGLAAGVAAVPHLPVYALGGVATANIGLCLAAGAAGVAVMGAVMAAEDPFTATRDLVAALERADQRKRSGPRR